ncbi:MAG: hypothetical protein GX675_03575 [Erysipelotrichaceae bacterium]|nr:hypothetical protein [Erysipelotrichaceae bacterium]
MNRFIILFLILLFVLVNISACSSKSNENLVVDDFTATEILQEELSIEIDITEDLYETDKFLIIVPSDWSVMEIDGGFRIYKSNLELIQIQYVGFNQGETHAMLQAKQLSKNSEGTGPEEIEILNKIFWHTTYLNGDIEAGYYARIEEGGIMLTIQTMKGTYETNKEYTKILDTVVFK